MRYFLPIFILFSSLKLSLIANGQYTFEEFRVGEDIPVSKISDLFYGNKGLVWLGSNNGIYYYEGYKFNKVESLSEKNNTLDRNYIYNISQDFNGRIWVLTEYGLECLFLQDNQLQRKIRIKDTRAITAVLHSNQLPEIYLTTPKYILRFNTKSEIVDTIYSSSKGIVGTPNCFDNKISFIEDSQLVQFNTSTHTSDFFSLKGIENNAQFIKLLAKNQNQIYISKDSDLYSYNIDEKKLHHIIAMPESIVDFTINKMNNVVVATLSEIYLVDFSGNNTPNQISLIKIQDNNMIKKVFSDENNLVWAATDKSILKVYPNSDVFKKDYFLKGRLDHSFKDRLLFEYGKKGVLFRDEEGKIFFYKNTNQFYLLPDNEYTSLCLVDDELLLGCSKGLISYNLNDNQEVKISDNLTVNSIKQIEGRVYVGADKGLYEFVGGRLIQIYKNQVWNFFYTNEGFYILYENGLGFIDKETSQISPLLERQYSEEAIEHFDILNSLDGSLWIGTDNGLYKFIIKSDSKGDHAEFELYYKGAVYALIEAPETTKIWFSTDLGLGAVNYRNGQVLFYGSEEGVNLGSYLPKGALYEPDGKVSFIAGLQKITFNTNEVYTNEIIPNVKISKVKLLGNKGIRSYVFPISDTLVVGPQIRYLELELTTLNYYAPRNTQFSYSIEGVGSTPVWKELTTGSRLSIGRLIPGRYELELRATNSHGVCSAKPKKVIVEVQSPILQTKLAYVLYLISLVILVMLLIQVRTRNLRRINKEYKEKELIARKIEIQKEELTLKNKNITDSINYARRIQLAMMPSIKIFSAIFPESFVLHMPKDIVSGDFYWVNQVKGQTFFSAVDCTGHGVPGAFMSIIGVELFRRITEIEGIDTPAEVLNSLSRNFDRVFGDVDEMKLRDGMDLAFCSLNEDHSTLQYAGAFNPLYIVRDSSILEFKADRYSVGVYDEEDESIERLFNNHVIPVKDGDTLYIFTDGFADQFGGPEGKKYKYRRFRHLLLALHQLPMEKQREFLRKSILEWKGDLDQVDDILVMGIKIRSVKK